jgi:hypothetical protein
MSLLRISVSNQTEEDLADAMPAALDGLIAKGYHLVTVSQLIALESHQLSSRSAPSPAGDLQKSRVR